MNDLKRPVWEGGQSKREYLAALAGWERACASAKAVQSDDPAPDDEHVDQTNAAPSVAPEAGTHDDTAPTVGKP